MSWTARRKAFRALLNGDKCICPASIYDPMSARVAQDIGYESVMLAGSVASLAHIGAPDIILLTQTEFVDLCARINRATSLPLVVDSDHGYGNALNAMRTIEELDLAGVCAATIEDTELPRPFGVAKPRPISIDEGVGKMRAAMAGKRDADFVMLARTGAIAMTGLDDALARFRAYEAAGVDGFFVAGLKTRAEIAAVHAITKLPLVIGAMTPELEDRDFLAAHGVRIALQGHSSYTASVEATRAVLQALRDGVAPKDLKGVPSDAFIKTTSREDVWAKATSSYLEPPTR